MKPRITSLPFKKMVGMRLHMSLVDNLTSILWRSFLPRIREIKNRAGSERYSLQSYPKSVNISDFGPNTFFDKWAAIEVSEVENLPEGMEYCELEGGLYAVFLHRGAAHTFPNTFQYIFGEWLPDSGYELDSRMQFEVMGASYDPFDPNAEEEVWIPIKN